MRGSVYLVYIPKLPIPSQLSNRSIINSKSIWHSRIRIQYSSQEAFYGKPMGEYSNRLRFIFWRNKLFYYSHHPDFHIFLGFSVRSLEIKIIRQNLIYNSGGINEFPRQSFPISLVHLHELRSESDIIFCKSIMLSYYPCGMSSPYCVRGINLIKHNTILL
jgi:hypothetical protein